MPLFIRLLIMWTLSGMLYNSVTCAVYSTARAPRRRGGERWQCFSRLRRVQTCLFTVGFKMEWNRENTALLIEHFKERRELWDPTSEHFKDRNKKHNAWIYLASKFDTKKSVVEKKMRSLIGQFQRELKKPRPGAGTEEITSKWFGFELLLFLKDKTKVRSTNEASILQDNPHENGTSPSKKKRKNFVGSKAHKEAYGFVKEFQTERKSRDHFTIFGEYIACRLGNLQDPFTISTVQNQIHNIIFQAEMSLYSGVANTMGMMTRGSANTIGSNSGSSSTSFNRGYYTSSPLNNSSDPADSPHTDTDTSQFSENFNDILLKIQKSPSNDNST